MAPNKQAESSQRTKAKMVIFDWDNTLYPTSSIIKNTTQASKIVNKPELTKLSQLALKMLQKYAQIFGEANLFIVTNGAKHWILQSLKMISKFCITNSIENSFELLFQYLSNSNISLISANYLYSIKYPKQTRLWKYAAFKQILSNKTISSLICIGDSLDEYHASQAVIKHTNINITLHRLKLTNEPTVEQMNKQFQFIMSLAHIYNTQTQNISIDYEKET